MWLTGLPCPGCGLTTAFAHLARGHWEASIAAHPLGLPLFLLVMLAVPLCALGVYRAWSLTTVLKRLAVERILGVLAIAGGVAWVARLIGAFLA